ncbi:hypothetical protein CRENBAI_008379 [Crenichthys baileyi]|uniref:Uncharacterized protein n=1 Tax=Crenichthys baileyi TaxID=28760 RepID=A0AAV9SL63_9TELE
MAKTEMMKITEPEVQMKGMMLKAAQKESLKKTQQTRELLLLLKWESLKLLLLQMPQRTGAAAGSSDALRRVDTGSAALWRHDAGSADDSRTLGEVVKARRRAEEGAAGGVDAGEARHRTRVLARWRKGDADILSVRLVVCAAWSSWWLDSLPDQSANRNLGAS